MTLVAIIYGLVHVLPSNSERLSCAKGKVARPRVCMIQSYSTYSHTAYMVNHMHKKKGHSACKIIHYCDTSYCRCVLYRKEVFIH